MRTEGRGKEKYSREEGKIKLCTENM